jgi:hypothetical protein
MTSQRSGNDANLEQQVRHLAQQFQYPTTPLIATAVRQNLRRPAHRPYRWAWTLAAIFALVFLAAALLASPARARIVEWLRVGAVRIFLIDPAITPIPTSPALNSELEGETTLLTAQEKVNFNLMIPLDVGEPDRVYYQEIDRAKLVIMLWQDLEQGDLALYQIQGPVSIINKRYVGSIEETVVGSEWAVWVEGPYELYIETGTEIDIRVVEGRTLLWQQDGITYRLESHLALEEARELAESLQPIAP